jgi:hypothetical protein
MLSQQYEEDNYQEQDKHVGNYKPTDIFNLAPAAATAGKRFSVDRNRSSVFAADDGSGPSSSFNPRKDRMASDIFFGGNQPATARFGAYEPSSGISRRSSAKETEYKETEYKAPVEDARELRGLKIILISRS